MTIGQRIKARRKELRISADELGKILGKDRSTIFRYEKGDIENLPLDILKPIADALDVTPSYLMGWETEPLHRFSLEAFYSSEDGNKLISSYLSLNEQGQKNLLDHCDLLLSSDKYYRDSAPKLGQLSLLPGKYTVPHEEKYALNAAHERTDIKVTDEMRKHDEDIMDDENF